MTKKQKKNTSHVVPGAIMRCGRGMVTTVLPSTHHSVLLSETTNIVFKWICTKTMISTQLYGFGGFTLINLNFTNKYQVFLLLLIRKSQVSKIV